MEWMIRAGRTQPIVERGEQEKKSNFLLGIVELELLASWTSDI